MSTAAPPAWERLEAPAPAEARLWRVSGFPMPSQEVAAAAALWARLAAAVPGYESEVFVQFAALAAGDGAARFMARAAGWRPEMGLGVWPGEPPPRGYTREDFENLGPDEQPRRIDHQALRINGERGVREQARETMLGLGAVLEIWAPHGLLDRARRLFHPTIQDPTFASFPFFVPLIRAASLRTAATDQVTEWLCGADLYVRESVEDGGILVVSPGPLAILLG